MTKHNDNIDLEDAFEIEDALVYLEDVDQRRKAAESLVADFGFHTWVGAGQRYFSKTTEDKAVRVATWQAPDTDYIGVQIMVYGDYDHDWSNLAAHNYDHPLQALLAYFAMVTSVRGA